MRLLLAGLPVSLFLAAPAASAEITVTTRADLVADDGRCSLREAVTAANTNSASGGCAAGELATDVIRLGDGHYSLSRAGARENANATGDLDLMDNGVVALRGTGRDRTVVSAEELDRVIDVLAGASVTIADLAITGGVAPDGAPGAAGTNPGGAGENGGGIRSAGKLELRDVAVRGNRAGRGGPGGNGDITFPGGPGGFGGEGGGIYSSDILSVIRTRVADNRAGAGGRGGSAFVGANAERPGGAGGGIAATGPTTVTDSAIESNRAGTGGDGGAGVGVVFGGHAASGGRGGGIAVGSGSITGSTVTGNSSGAGGRGGDGIQRGGDGGAGGDGGGVHATGVLTVTGTLFAGNATGDGGGGGNPGAVPMTVTGKGGPGGSGAGLVGADVVVASSTFVAGTVGAGGPGGTPAGLDGFPGTTTAVRAVGTVTLARTIVAGSCDGTVNDGGGNLGTDPTCQVPVANPLLEASGMPGAGSPAIDAAASCPTVDLAGTARPQGAACDVGALEVPAPAASVGRSGLDFGSVTVGGAVARSVDVGNPGLPGLPLAIGVSGDPAFTLAGHTCGAVLAGGAGCAITVRFAPAAAGSPAGTLRIGGEALALTGTGVAPAAPQATKRCVVPRLKGKTVKSARRALRNANCKLGKVTRRGRGRKGRVRSFSPRAGTSLPTGATVRLVLNRRPRR